MITVRIMIAETIMMIIAQQGHFKELKACFVVLGPARAVMVTLLAAARLIHSSELAIQVSTFHWYARILSQHIHHKKKWIQIEKVYSLPQNWQQIIYQLVRIHPNRTPVPVTTQ